MVVATKSKGIGRGGARAGAGRKRKLGAVEIEARFAEKPEAVIRKAARSGGKADAVQIGEALGWAPDEVAEDIRPGGGARADLAPVAREERVVPLPESAVEMRGVALATLLSVMNNSLSDPARVSAAKEVLARADAEAVINGGGTGKKATALAEAKAMVDDDDWGDDISASLGGEHKTLQ